MCGIAGLLARAAQPVDTVALENMVKAVAHRGPDGEGIYVSGRVGLGHRRLAIIDLSEQGAQPMRHAASGCVIVYNGEIYNYLEIRAELSKNGYRFDTATDTEVILAAYHRWGEECVQRFNGMWSFAIFDPDAGTVFCSRDRFGVKPFYYVDDFRFFAFGSEIRQLLPLLPAREANYDVLLDFLCLSTDERGTDTFFAGVQRLAPGNNLLYRVETGRFEIRQYYHIPETEGPRLKTGREASDVFRCLLADAVRVRLRSDVPVGTCLSGGLDSSSVAVLAAARNPDIQGHRFAAITAGSEDPASDESAYAQAVVDHANLDWHQICPTFDAFASNLREVVRAQEEPFGSPSVCMQFFVMQEAKRQKLPVLLDGQGGDETLLGYERYSVAYIKECFKREGLLAATGAMRDLARNNAKLGFVSQILFLVYFSFPVLRWSALRLRMRRIRPFPSLQRFLRRYGRPISGIFELQQREIEEDSVPHLLRYEDKNAMWHSIETRLPFLDYRVVEFALGLPVEAKIKSGWTKFVLREAMLDLLPASIRWRKNKRGFEAPDNLWLPRLQPTMLREISKSTLLRELFRPTRRTPHLERLPQAALWRFYVVSLWEQEFGVSGVYHSEAKNE